LISLRAGRSNGRFLVRSALHTAKSHRRLDWLIPGCFALLTFTIHLIFYRGYGFFRDELYFIACSHRLDWGYVDMPPGVPMVAWIARHLFGDTLFAIRIVPVCFAAMQVFLTGLTARVIGARTYGVALACLCVLAAPQYFGSWLNTDMFMMLGWAACAWVAARIFAGESERLWLLFGLFAGAAVEGKHAMAFFGVAFIAGLLVSPQRKMLLSRWFWAGLGVTFLIALPNLIWQFQHHWATYELLSNIARSNKNLVLGPAQYLWSNINSIGIFSLPVWIAGLGWCLFAKQGARFRALGWTWVFAYVLFIGLKGKDYYLTPVYPMLYAAGAVAIEKFICLRGRYFRLALQPLLMILVLCSTVGWPFGMPMMSVEKFIAYEEKLHATPAKTETTELSQLPQQYADMFGWPEMAAAVARVYQALRPDERSRCGIYARNYGEAGAIEYFGRQYGLPQVISGHQNYWLWGPGAYTGECMIFVGGTREWLEKYFSDVQQAGETYQRYALPLENHRPIWVARAPKFHSFREIWGDFKAWI
jgi:hypothetical protein